MDKGYEVVHGFGHEGVYYTRDNQHEIAKNVDAEVINVLLNQKMIREVTVLNGQNTLDEQHAALRKTPDAKAYSDALKSSLDERGLTGVAEATEEVARASVDALPGESIATGSGAVEAARSRSKSTKRGGR